MLSGMKILIAILSLFTLTANAAPPSGDFDRAQLYGMYQFESCTNSGSTIWEGEHQRQYIVVSHDPFDTRSMPEDYMAAALFHTPYNPLVPIWELADLNKGWVKEIDDKTGAVRTAPGSRLCAALGRDDNRKLTSLTTSGAPPAAGRAGAG